MRLRPVLNDSVGGHAGVVALVVALLWATSGHGLVHACPHHEPVTSSESAVAAGPLTGADTETAHASSAGQVVLDHAAGAHYHDSPEAPCACVGLCHGSSAAPHAAAAGSTQTVLGLTATAPTPLASDPDRPTRTALRLHPFPNGPPRTL